MPIHAKRCLLAVQPDRRLAQLVAEGHEQAFEALVHRYRRPLLRYCARLGLQDGCREDAVQHALLRAWLALARGSEVREVRPWLYRIAHNAAVDALRSPAHGHAVLSEDATPSLAAAEGEIEARIAARETLAEVAALPQLQREAILMSAVDGASHEEVASALGVSDGAVRGLLYRARTSLRAAAAAFTPQPLIAWASGYASRLAPSASRLAELSGSTAGTGAAVGLLKGALLAGTTAAVVAGVVVRPHAPPRPARVERAAVSTFSTAGARAHEGSSEQAISRAPVAGGLSRGDRPGRRMPRRSESATLILPAAPAGSHDGFGGSRGYGGDMQSGARRLSGQRSADEGEGGHALDGAEVSKEASNSGDGGSSGSGPNAASSESSDGSQSSPSSSGSSGTSTGSDGSSSLSSDGSGGGGGGSGDTSTTSTSSGDGSSSSTSTSTSGGGSGEEEPGS
jgi:RNA polymerase sigma factor (sigma-70 family)